jgi:hypothetical protein
MNDKQRVDTALVRRGLAAEPRKGAGADMSGNVYLREVKVLKPSETIGPEDELTVKRRPPLRGPRGVKLEKALSSFTSSGGMTRWTSARRRAALRTCCSAAARAACSPWTWGTASWTGSCATTRA